MDITLCSNTDCPLKEKCKRAKRQNTLKSHQSYALFKPKINNETLKQECEFFLKI